MELMQLEMLVATVEEGGIHKGAVRVLRSQPAVSMALRKLEEEIGAPIFDRSRRRHYTLTKAGEMLYGYAKRLLKLRDEALLVLDDHNCPQQISGHAEKHEIAARAHQ